MRAARPWCTYLMRSGEECLPREMGVRRVGTEGSSNIKFPQERVAQLICRRHLATLSREKC